MSHLAVCVQRCRTSVLIASFVPVLAGCGSGSSSAPQQPIGNMSQQQADDSAASPSGMPTATEESAEQVQETSKATDTVASKGPVSELQQQANDFSGTDVERPLEKKVKVSMLKPNHFIILEEIEDRPYVLKITEVSAAGAIKGISAVTTCT